MKHITYLIVQLTVESKLSKIELWNKLTNDTTIQSKYLKADIVSVTNAPVHLTLDDAQLNPEAEYLVPGRSNARDWTCLCGNNTMGSFPPCDRNGREINPPSPEGEYLNVCGNCGRIADALTLQVIAQRI